MTVENSLFTGVYFPYHFVCVSKTGTHVVSNSRGGGAYEVDGAWRSTSFDMRKLSKDDPVVEVQ